MIVHPELLFDKPCLIDCVEKGSIIKGLVLVVLVIACKCQFYRCTGTNKDIRYCGRYNSSQQIQIHMIDMDGPWL